MAKSHYFEVHIEYSKEDLGFIAKSPQIKYLSAWGTTIEEAMMEFGNALALFMELEIKDMAKNTLDNGNRSLRAAYLLSKIKVDLIPSEGQRWEYWSDWLKRMKIC